jgi:ATP-dependent DNA helicase DinG
VTSTPAPRAEDESASARLLGPEGPLARALPGYEAREGQLEMARSVERALREDRILFVEAGTGTGKTLAYLVPAILSGRKVIISTATRALQEQIVGKDVPVAARVAGREPELAVMKGLGNYVCRRRLTEFKTSVESLRPGYARALESLRSWVEETETGDIAELAGLAEDDPIWPHVTASSETRLGTACPFHDECFVTRMKRDAERARLVVVNHHLFFADLALRGNHPGRVLPDYDAVIFDEAHQLEDVATNFFGLRVSRARIEGLVGDFARLMKRVEAADVSLGEATTRGFADRVRQASDGFWEMLRAELTGDEPRVVVERDVWQGPLQNEHLALDAALDELSALVRSTAGRLLGGAISQVRDAAGIADALDAVDRRIEILREQLARIVDGEPGLITWAEVDLRRAAIGASPIDLSGLMRARIFESVPSVVLTSATLTSTGSGNRGPSFEYVRSRLGVRDAALEIQELIVPSPFEYRHAALLYVPRDLPPPSDPSFVGAAIDRAEELVRSSDGGAFVLTTSLRSLQAMHRELARRLRDRPVWVQGEAPKHVLVSAFRASRRGVLVATLSFWEGVDVPGDALRLVVLEKIPFAAPTDPIVKARALALEAEGRNPFLELSVPAAAILLKQGFGRLIRTRSDRGVVALLDSRVHQRGYGQRLLAALPPAPRTPSLADVRAFWPELLVK